MYINYIGTISKIFIIILSMFFILTKKRKVAEWCFLLFITILTLVITVNSKSFDLPFTILILLCSYDKDIEYLMKNILWGMITGIFTVLLLFLLGVIPDVVQVRLGVIRRSLGFSLPIILPALFFSLTTCYIFCKKEKLKKSECLIFVIIGYVISTLCDGRAPFILTILIVFGTIIIDYFDISKLKFIKYLGIFSLLSAISISMYFYYNYNSNNALHLTINQLLTGRIEWWNLYRNEYFIKLFGQEIMRVGGAANNLDINHRMMILDNAFISILLEYGVIMCILSILFLLKPMTTKIVYYEKKDYVILFIFITWIIYGVVSNQLYFIDRNFSLLMMSSLIYRRKLKEKRNV